CVEPTERTAWHQRNLQRDPRLVGRQKFYNSRAESRTRELSRTYHRLLHEYFAFMVPPGARVLEVGCGLGDLLASVKPAYGVGVDLSPRMVELARQRHPTLEFRVAEALEFPADEQFDYILLSDLANELTDVQALFIALREHVHCDSRLVINYF